METGSNAGYFYRHIIAEYDHKLVLYLVACCFAYRQSDKPSAHACDINLNSEIFFRLRRNEARLSRICRKCSVICKFFVISL